MIMHVLPTLMMHGYRNANANVWQITLNIYRMLNLFAQIELPTDGCSFIRVVLLIVIALGKELMQTYRMPCYEISSLLPVAGPSLGTCGQ